MSNDWRLECYEEPQETDGCCIQGIARLGKRGTKFCIAGDASVVLFLLVEPTPIGLEFVRGFEEWFGRSTLLYMFECGGVKGYWATGLEKSPSEATAIWYCFEYPKPMV